MFPQAVINVFARNPLKFSRRSSSIVEPPTAVSVLQKSTRSENQDTQTDAHVRVKSSCSLHDSVKRAPDALVENEVIGCPVPEATVVDKSSTMAPQEGVNEAPEVEVENQARTYEQVVASAEQSETTCISTAPAFASVTAPTSACAHIETMSVPTPEEISASSMLDVKKDSATLSMRPSGAAAADKDLPASLSFASFGSSYDSVPEDEVADFSTAVSSPVPPQADTFVPGEAAATGGSTELCVDTVSDALDALSIIPEAPSSAELETGAQPDPVNAPLVENASNSVHPACPLPPSSTPDSTSHAATNVNVVNAPIDCNREPVQLGSRPPDPAVSPVPIALLEDAATEPAACKREPNEPLISSSPCPTSAAVTVPQASVDGDSAAQAASCDPLPVLLASSSNPTSGPVTDSGAGPAPRIGETTIESLGIPLPKTYADATNLALKYPELSQQILKLPLASVSPVKDRGEKTATESVSSSGNAGDSVNRSVVQSRKQMYETPKPTPPSKIPNWAAGSRVPSNAGPLHNADPNWALAPDMHKAIPPTRPQNGFGRERSGGHPRGNRRGGRSAPSTRGERIDDMRAMTVQSMNLTRAPVDIVDAHTALVRAQNSAPGGLSNTMPLAEYLDRRLAMSARGSAATTPGVSYCDSDKSFDPNPLAVEFVPGRTNTRLSLPAPCSESMSLTPSASLPASRPPSRPSSRASVTQDGQRMILHHLGMSSRGNTRPGSRVPTPDPREQEAEKTSANANAGPKASDAPVLKANDGPPLRAGDVVSSKPSDVAPPRANNVAPSQASSVPPEAIKSASAQASNIPPPRTSIAPLPASNVQPGPVSMGWRMGEDGILRRDCDWSWIPTAGQDVVSAASSLALREQLIAVTALAAASASNPAAAAPTAAPSYPLMGAQWTPPDEHAWMQPSSRQSARHPVAAQTSFDIAGGRGRGLNPAAGRGRAGVRAHPRSSFGNNDFVLPPELSVEPPQASSTALAAGASANAQSPALIWVANKNEGQGRA